MSIAHKLDTLVAAIEQRKWSIRPGLQPGLTADEISTIVQPLNLLIPAVVYDIYQWHNGTMDGWPPLFDEHYFLPLETASNEYMALVPIWEQYDADAKVDLTHWFPFAGFMGAYYMIACEPDSTDGLSYPIIHMFHDSYVAFVDFTAMVTTMTEWYRRGAYNMKTLNKPLKEHIWQDLNPGLNRERL